MRFAASLVIVCLTSANAAGAIGSPAPALEALLAAANRASGAPYRHSIRSIGGEPTADRSISVTVDEAGLKFIRRRCDRTLCSGFFFDGLRRYAINSNDTALPLSRRTDASELTLRTIVSYLFTDPSFQIEGGTVVERRSAAVADDGARHVIVTPRGGVAMDVGIDERSALVTSASSLDGRFRFIFGDQRPAGDGVVLPFAIDFNHRPLERFERRSLSEVPVERPTGLEPRFGGGAAPIRLYGTRVANLPVADCTIGGQSAQCLLDTGNSGMAMSLELAERLGLEPIAAPFVIRGLGSYVTGIVRAPPLTIGDVSYPIASYVVLHDIHRLGYDLILGADAFANARITIDYARRSLTIAPPGGGLAGDAIGLGFENFVPVVAAKVGDFDARLALDTGDESTINLAEQYYGAHPAIFKPTGKAPVGGVGGTSEEIVGEIERVRVGNFSVEHQPIGATKHLAPTADGHLGDGFLSHFAVVFDYARERIGLVPRVGDAAVKREAVTL